VKVTQDKLQTREGEDVGESSEDVVEGRDDNIAVGYPGPFLVNKLVD
jgi:hypothetical protein